jgi:hypothetical protein
MKEQTPFDDFFKDRLGEHVSPVSDSIFDRLMGEREAAVPDENPTQFFKDKLEDFESPVPKGVFDSIIMAHEENQVGNFFKNALENHASAVPTGLFEGMMQAREETQTSDIFKGKLDHHASSVPTDMFDRIMGKRKRPILWWQPNRVAAAALVLFLGLSSMGYLFLNKKENKEVIVENLSKNGKNMEYSDIPNPFGTEGPLSIENQQKSIDNQIITHNNIIDFDEKINKNKDLSSASAPSKWGTKTASKITNNTINLTVLIPPTSITPNANTDFSEPKGTVPSQQNQSYGQIISKTDDQKPINTDYLIQTLPLVQNTALAGKNTEGPPSLTNESLCAMLPDGCPTFGRRRMGKTWFIEAYGAPELMMRRLKPNSSEFESYRQARDSSETVLLGYAAGVRAAMVFDNGIVVKGGVAYVNGREKFVRDSVGYDPNIVKIIKLNTQTGATDTIIESTVGIYRTTRFNQYRSLDFSLQGGYEIALNQNFTVGFNAGANVHLWQAKKASFYDSALQLQDMSNNENVFNQYLGVNLVGSITAYWRMTDRTQLMVEPYVRHYLQPITNSNYQIQQSYTNVGLAIGLRYRL